MKPGAVFLAKYTDRLMMPVICDCKRFKRFNSWDGFILPYPFARINVHYCEPVIVDGDHSPEKIKKDITDIEKYTMEQSLVYSESIL
jgi:lysophospholipid acyltransferase (LPLAT)-like uncharacterized protein